MAVTALAIPTTSATSTPQEPSPRASASSAGADQSSSWAPAPHRGTDLSTLAVTDAHGLRLRTAGGVRDFIAGVDVGATTPGHLPGELAISAAEYRRWFEQMGSLGIRALRIYTIHPPTFYRELLAYNQANPTAPLYLMQGVYLTDETALTSGGTLYDQKVDDDFAAEVADATLAVRGALHRDETPGRAFGDWDADVSRWLLGWVIGVEWDPEATLRTDQEHADAPAIEGQYFRSTSEATPSERWLARHMNALAEIQARNGYSMPIAFVNWPTTDPLSHADEPHPAEDLVGIDANHVQPTAAWPGGTFASYHAYPYYPDFLRYEKDLRKTVVDGRPDPYAGYLAALKKHHPDMPVMITELGVPSAMGSAHNGTLGRDQGGHSEQDAMAINASLLRTVKDQGLAGAFLFSWSDEWFKFTWNTVEHQIPAENRARWHDPLTNEQYFGLLAHDSQPLDGAHRVVTPDAGSGIARVQLDADASYLYLDVTYGSSSRPEPATSKLVVGVDTVPGGAPTAESGGEVDAADYRIEVDPTASVARATVRSALAPARWDTWESLPESGRPWQLFRLVTNRSYAGVDTSTLETQDVGVLRRGTWQVDSARPDSLATWQTAGDTVRMRIPWSMIGIADPSTWMALGEGADPNATPIDKITLNLAVAGQSPTTLRYTWPTWTEIGYSERLKSGADVVAQAFRELND